MIKQISRLTLVYNNWARIGYWSSNTKRMGDALVTELPKLEIPVRQRHPDEQQMPTDLLYSTQGYTKHEREPRCNYYALEFKGRIYHVFNAYYYPMGRMIHKISNAIRGKNSPLYSNCHANVKNGDICVIVNAKDPLFTGKKLLYKDLKYHSGFIGHLKTHSYKSVLNRTPELLYYYLLRKAMPKNRLSKEYMENVKIYRGPTHDLKHLPQFAPDNNIYDYLPEINMKQYIKDHPQDVKLLHEDKQGLAEQLIGIKLQKQDLREESTEFKQVEPRRMIPNINVRQYQKLLRHQKRMEYRHKVIRAPINKKKINQDDLGYEYLKDERKARKRPDYEMLADEDAQEDEEQIFPDPLGRKKEDQSKKDTKQTKDTKGNKEPSKQDKDKKDPPKQNKDKNDGKDKKK